MIAGLAIGFTSCDEEDTLSSTEKLGIKENFMPKETETQKVKDIYNEFGVWIRMDYDDAKEVENAMLEKDPYNRGQVTKIDDEYRASAYKYIETLFENVPSEFTNKCFPLDLFIVKSYGAPWWAVDFKRFGRSRFLMSWPNQTKNALTVDLENFDHHYYQDTVLTTKVWANLSGISALLIDEVEDIANAGLPYDEGAVKKIRDMYPYGDPRRDIELNKLAAEGGFISASGSASFESDIAEWIAAIALHSYEEMQVKYLNESPLRKVKYEEVIKFMTSIGWDIQATGNKYSQMKMEYKLPDPQI